MKRILTVAIALAGLGVTFSGRVSAIENSAARADQTRAVYFSAIDAKGAAVTDLTAADLSVKEGGKDRAISSVKPATEPMTVAILVDDQGSGAFQGALGQFLQTTLGHAQFAISMLNPQPTRLTTYTGDVDALKAALARLGQRGRLTPDGEQMIEGIGEVSRELRQKKAVRPVVLVLTISGETALSDRADPVLNDLRDSGASLNVLYYTGIELGKVLGDGPKQSGGMIQQAATGPAIPAALMKITDNLMHQYVLTYTLPDGVKPSEKLSVATSRKGLTLIAPSRIPDK